MTVYSLYKKEDYDETERCNLNFCGANMYLKFIQESTESTESTESLELIGTLKEGEALFFTIHRPIMSPNCCCTDFNIGNPLITKEDISYTDLMTEYINNAKSSNNDIEFNNNNLSSFMNKLYRPYHDDIFYIIRIKFEQVLEFQESEKFYESLIFGEHVGKYLECSYNDRCNIIANYRSPYVFHYSKNEKVLEFQKPLYESLTFDEYRDAFPEWLDEYRDDNAF
jgi:hypothetical protein